MSLIFSSGGGRLGNQLLNLIHLTALSYEYNIKVYKISDLFITSKKNSLFFEISRNYVNWKLVYDFSKIKKSKIFILKIFIRLIHICYYFLPNKISYKLGSKNNIPKFIIGKSLEKDFSIIKLIREAKNNDVVLSGWGFREWDLVLKHKKSIINNFYIGLSPIINLDKKIENNYLFVHIRRSDFLEEEEFRDLNFSDEIWLKSIIKICQFESIQSVVIFSDSNINDFMVSSLKSKNINVYIKNSGNLNSYFLESFIYYLSKAKSVVCNASTLVLGISFLFHQKIYLPSISKNFQNIIINDAHYTYPTRLNWN